MPSDSQDLTAPHSPSPTSPSHKPSFCPCTQQPLHGLFLPGETLAGSPSAFAGVPQNGSFGTEHQAKNLPQLKSKTLNSLVHTKL